MKPMTMNQMYAIVKTAYNQITGITPLDTLDATNFQNVANTLKTIGHNRLIPGLVEQFAKIKYTEIPYNAEYKSIMQGMDAFGFSTRTVSTIIPFDEEGNPTPYAAPESNSSWSVQNGQQFGVYTAKFPAVITTWNEGESAYDVEWTMTRDALKNAFASPEAMRNYLNDLLTYIENQLVQYTEAVARSVTVSVMASKIEMDKEAKKPNPITNGEHVVHLVSDWNAEMNGGSAMTIEDIRKASDTLKVASFKHYVITRIKEGIKILGNRDTRNIVNFIEPVVVSNANNPSETATIPGGYFLRFCKNPHLLANSEFMDWLDADSKLATHFESATETMPAYEKVDYWQCPDRGTNGLGKMTIKAKANILKNNGTVQAMSEAVETPFVLGMLYDPNMVSAGLAESWRGDSGAPDAKYGLTQYVQHQRYKYYTDFTFPGIVYVLD